MAEFSDYMHRRLDLEDIYRQFEDSQTFTVTLTDIQVIRALVDYSNDNGIGTNQAATEILRRYLILDKE